MALVDLPCASPSLVWPDARPHNKDASRLPPYRSSHLDRYHPYPRVMPAARRLANDTVQEAARDRARPKESAQDAEFLITTPPSQPPQRATACQERPDVDVEPYEDEALAAVDDPAGGQPTPHPVRRTKLTAALADPVAVMRRRYRALLEAVRQFLEANRGRERK
ncbi:hypothetical protein PYCCODRAFT_1462546 [Trametes coccinea BRFM310]|uniref:Uncharacterized protein n=1 Tax=Trametes coccinea (strain BRFM310) TaxID=1353009 RepID=A0A1Y2J7R5_TRAC3|nr:hypothetical protein PYCCODRAFT_1462546 [Trametes coccinea BRFM310]